MEMFKVEFLDKLKIVYSEPIDEEIVEQDKLKVARAILRDRSIDQKLILQIVPFLTKTKVGLVYLNTYYGDIKAKELEEEAN